MMVNDDNALRTFTQISSSQSGIESRWTLKSRGNITMPAVPFRACMLAFFFSMSPFLIADLRQTVAKTSQSLRIGPTGKHERHAVPPNGDTDYETHVMANHDPYHAKGNISTPTAFQHYLSVWPLPRPDVCSLQHSWTCSRQIRRKRPPSTTQAVHVHIIDPDDVYCAVHMLRKRIPKFSIP
jgi:hypothetical protein